MGGRVGTKRDRDTCSKYQLGLFWCDEGQRGRHTCRHLDRLNTKQISRERQSDWLSGNWQLERERGAFGETKIRSKRCLIYFYAALDWVGVKIPTRLV